MEQGLVTAVLSHDLITPSTMATALGHSRMIDLKRASHGLDFTA